MPTWQAAEAGPTQIFETAAADGYLRFAQTEPGLFRAAFSVPGTMAEAKVGTSAGTGGLTPCQLLGAALDDLVACGRMPTDRRPGMEFLVRSAVHGLAVPLIDGPLRGLQTAQTDEATRLLIDMIERGL
ncbi:TetR-like C-terminal domain-containing protein [Nonomuraea sp. H19]|uniref:TetR-like C-terminal domain-containing protein n=1 Tax=Nonomuraea sp. H19 TaxID=3452206 RepID=UPI003F88DAD9